MFFSFFRVFWHFFPDLGHEWVTDVASFSNQSIAFAEPFRHTQQSVDGSPLVLDRPLYPMFLVLPGREHQRLKERAAANLARKHLLAGLDVRAVPVKPSVQVVNLANDH